LNFGGEDRNRVAVCRLCNAIIASKPPCWTTALHDSLYITAGILTVDPCPKTTRVLLQLFLVTVFS